MTTTHKHWSRFLAQVLIAALLLCLLPFGAAAAEIPQSQATFSFTGQTIAGEGAVLSNEISGSTLTIKQSGVYTLTGSCADGGVVVSKGVTGVTLILRDLILASAKGAPITVEAGAEATLYLIGTNALNNTAVRPEKAEKPVEPPVPAEPEAVTAEASAEGACATVNGKTAKNAKWNKNANRAKKADKTEKTGKTVQRGVGFDGSAIKVKTAAKLTITGEGMIFLNGAGRAAISCAKNAKATLKGNALNFNKKYVQMTEKPAPVEDPAEKAEPAAEPTPELPAEPAPAEEGAAAAVTAKKACQNKNRNGVKGQKTIKMNRSGMPLDIKAGDTLTVKDAEGSVIFNAVAPIDAKQVIFVSEKLSAKQVYSLFAGETEAAKATARAAASLVGTGMGQFSKKSQKNAKNGMIRKRNSKKSTDRAQPAAEPAAAPSEAAGVA